MSKKTMLALLMAFCVIAPSKAVHARGGWVELDSYTYQYGPGDAVELYYDTHPDYGSYADYVEVTGDDGFYFGGWCYPPYGLVYDHPGDYNGGGVWYTAYATYAGEGESPWPEDDRTIVPPSEESGPTAAFFEESYPVFVAAQPPVPYGVEIDGADYYQNPADLTTMQNFFPWLQCSDSQSACNGSYPPWFRENHDAIYTQWLQPVSQQTDLYESMTGNPFQSGCVRSGATWTTYTPSSPAHYVPNNTFHDYFWAHMQGCSTCCSGSSCQGCNFTMNDTWKLVSNNSTLWPTVFYLNYRCDGFTFGYNGG
ncbi:MAG TPA: hypothetical protein VIU63_08595 [Nitrospira sp.]